MKWFRVALLVVALAAAGVLCEAGSADALTGRCPSGVNGDFCLYYNSAEQGAMREWFDSDPDFAGETFWGSGLAGDGYPVKNDAASAENAYLSDWVAGVVYYNSNYQGTSDWYNSYTVGNLVSTYNENASFNWVEY